MVPTKRCSVGVGSSWDLFFGETTPKPRVKEWWRVVLKKITFSPFTHNFTRTEGRRPILRISYVGVIGILFGQDSQDDDSIDNRDALFLRPTNRQIDDISVYYVRG